MVLVCHHVLSLLANVSHRRGDGWPGGPPLPVIHLLLSSHPGSFCCHSARPAQDSVSCSLGRGRIECDAYPIEKVGEALELTTNTIMHVGESLACDTAKSYRMVGNF